ncbi:MAG: molybdenum cofactor guanylyltransferase MobA [Hyphomicrobiaceae bacterium]
MNAADDVVGLILAGGRSRRMGGGDKALLDLDGRPMLAHVIDRLRPQVRELAINANGDPARFAGLEMPVVADTVKGYLGPLAGILAGMRWAEGLRQPPRWVVTASGDAPLLPRDLVDRLKAAADCPGGVVIAGVPGKLHHVIGLWPIALSGDLEAALARGERKVAHWVDRHHAVSVQFEPVRMEDRDIDPFFNVNTPAELDDLRALVRKMRP